MLENFEDSSLLLSPKDVRLIPFSTISQEALIGEGGYGKVYFGRWQGIEVAIKQLHSKILSPNLGTLFEHEASMMARCQFPHIVQLYGITKDDEQYGLVMEYMAKGSFISYTP